ncbi:MAG: hypothetical protein ACR2P4_07095 [Gammaproteobacteria bacterium]
MTSHKMKLQQGGVCIGRRKIALNNFPRLLVAYRTDFLRPASRKRHFPLENRGDEWCMKGLPGSAEIKKFVPDVCTWGGYSGIAGRVLKNANIRKAFGEALKFAKDGKQDAAICSLLVLNGLGISFASKHLRMMSSRTCVVFDRILQENLPYPSDVSGYREFCRDCVQLAKLLNARGVKYPQKELQDACNKDGIATKVRAKWRAADVESAIFYSVFPKSGK